MQPELLSTTLLHGRLPALLAGCTGEIGEHGRYPLLGSRQVPEAVSNSEPYSHVISARHIKVEVQPTQRKIQSDEVCL